MIRANVENDLVVLELSERKRDEFLDADVALALAEQLLAAADDASKHWPKSLDQMRPYKILIRPAYGQVLIRIDPPEPGFVDRVPMPAWAARTFAAKLRSSAGVVINHNLDIRVNSGSVYNDPPTTLTGSTP